MIELSERTTELIDKIFRPIDRSEVRQLLEIECAEIIPNCEDYDKYEMERIRISVLKLSEGEMDKLVSAIQLAQIDWRDLFMAAGFGHDPEAHTKWSLKQ